MAMSVEGLNVFLSGPMTGYDDYNERGFVAAHIRLKKLGAEHVYDPILQWVCEPERISVVRSHESYMLECVQELSRMRDDGEPYYDAVVQIDGWQASEGAKVEDIVAEACGIMRIPFSAFADDGDGGSDVSESDDATPASTDGVDMGDVIERDVDRLWDVWYAMATEWECVDEHGHVEGNVMTATKDVHPVAVAELLAIQSELESHGVGADDLASARIIEAGSTGMNAFVNHVICDFTRQDGKQGHLNFEMSGPAIPNDRERMSGETDVDSLVWRDWL